MKRMSGFVPLWIAVVTVSLICSVSWGGEKKQPPKLKPGIKSKKLPEKKDAKSQPEPELISQLDSPFQSPLDFSRLNLRRAPEMLGDQPPLFMAFQQQQIFQPLPPDLQQQQQANLFLPGLRGFKVADNGSPRPQDRFYFSFNYFDDLNQSLNRRPGNALRHVHVYQSTFGIEKTLLGGRMSVALSLPINTAQINTNVMPLRGTHTDMGDLSVITRFALLADPQQDNWLTAGLAVTAPTGPDTFADVPAPATQPHSTVLQPFAAFLYHWRNFYIQGFIAVDTPTDGDDVVLLFNDIGIGYFLFENPDGFVQACIPTFEVHVATPLNNRSPNNPANPIGAFDEVNLTIANNLEFRNGSRLAAGVAVPVTGPRPFDIEAIVQLRCRY